MRTADGRLVTTTTQPIALEAGGFRAAGELKAGDRIWRWDGKQRRAAAVVGLMPRPDAVQVFNLVLGAPTTFVVGDFLEVVFVDAAEQREGFDPVAAHRSTFRARWSRASASSRRANAIACRSACRTSPRRRYRVRSAAALHRRSAVSAA